MTVRGSPCTRLLPLRRVQVRAVGRSDGAAPWQVSNYFTKKSSRPMDSLGNIIDSPDHTAESFAWTTDAKIRVAAMALSEEFRVDAESLVHMVSQLANIVPGGERVVGRLKPADQVRLAARLEQVPERLIALREALPAGVDVTMVLAKWPEAVLINPDTIKSGVDLIETVFQGILDASGVAAMIHTTPQLLQEGVLDACLKGAGHLMPLSQLADSLIRYDDYWMQFQSLRGEPRNDYDELLKDVNYYLNQDASTTTANHDAA